MPHTLQKCQFTIPSRRGATSKTKKHTTYRHPSTPEHLLINIHTREPGAHDTNTIDHREAGFCANNDRQLAGKNGTESR